MPIPPGAKPPSSMWLRDLQALSNARQRLKMAEFFFDKFDRILGDTTPPLDPEVHYYLSAFVVNVHSVWDMMEQEHRNTPGFSEWLLAHKQKHAVLYARFKALSRDLLYKAPLAVEPRGLAVRFHLVTLPDGQLIFDACWQYFFVMDEVVTEFEATFSGLPPLADVAASN